MQAFFSTEIGFLFYTAFSDSIEPAFSSRIFRTLSFFFAFSVSAFSQSFSSNSQPRRQNTARPEGPSASYFSFFSFSSELRTYLFIHYILYEITLKRII